MSTLDFKCALVTGGAGGLGRAFSEYLLSQGKKVIIAGRTRANLEATAREIKATAFYVLDTGALPTLPDFVATITREHPELDCLINNAGVQRPLEATKQSAAEFLEKATQETDINVHGPISLALHLLPHFRTKPYACVMNVTSGLGFVPFSVINPTYNGTKAYMHFFSVNLRTQLARDEATRHIRVIEIVPPMVETDLHRERENPDDNKKEKSGGLAMSVSEFMDDVVDGWKRGDDTVAAGMAKQLSQKWFDTYGPIYDKFAH